MIFSLVFILNIIHITSAIEGIIWSKSEQDFVPLFSILTFSVVKNDCLRKSLELEHHNFHGEILKVAYYQELNLVDFIENNTKISGICGEIWTVIADYLNFTLLPIKIEHRQSGTKLDNGSYNGILGMVERDEAQVIPRANIIMEHLSVLDYTIPLWSVRYHLYLKPEWKHDEAWMFHLFGLTLWYSFFMMLFILGIAGFVYEKYAVDISKNQSHFKLQDHMTYTFGIAASQGWVPAKLRSKAKIIYMCTSMFSWLVLIAFNSHAMFLMKHKKFDLPFTNLKTLIQKSDYDVIAFKGSSVHDDFKKLVATMFRYKSDADRVSYATSAKELYKKVCFSGKDLAAFEPEDRYRAVGKHICKLKRPQMSYFSSWISSAVKRGFKYKRSFDLGILKMFESGLLEGSKSRWLEWKIEEIDIVPFQSIDISQVYLIFAILFSGFVASILILLTEYLTFFKSQLCKCRKTNKATTVAKK